MGKDHKPRIIFKLLIDLQHILVHDRADALACREEIFCYIDFAFEVGLINPAAILVDKRKWLHIIQHLESLLAVTRDHFRQGEIKAKNQNNKKNQSGLVPFYSWGYNSRAKVQKDLPRKRDITIRLQHCCI